MSTVRRTVVDTNVLVSALLSTGSVPGRAVQLILGEYELLMSAPAFTEIEAVLGRRKFSKVLSLPRQQEFLKRLRLAAEFVSITSCIRQCRDPRDDIFLELAVEGNAQMIVTGDDDLLALDPFGGIRILRPRQFLEFERIRNGYTSS